MKKINGLILLSLLVFGSILFFGCSSNSEQSSEPTYKYISAENFLNDIKSKKEMILLDIQGAIPTYAYPVETAEQKAMLDSVLPELKGNKKPIIIICPGGGKGVTNTFDHLVDQGVDGSRIFILENGQKGWPYVKLLAQ